MNDELLKCSLCGAKACQAYKIKKADFTLSLCDICSPSFGARLIIGTYSIEELVNLQQSNPEGFMYELCYFLQKTIDERLDNVPLKELVPDHLH